MADPPPNFHDIDENVLKARFWVCDLTMIRKLQDLSGDDPNDIPMDDAGVMALFSGTDILGVTPGIRRLVCWNFGVWPANFVRNGY